MDIKDKVAVVTGGASGLGRATVKRLVAAGGKCAIFDMNEEKGNALVEELGDSVIFQNVNVADEESVKAGIAATMDAFGAIHINCNFAGIGNAMRTMGKARRAFDMMCERALSRETQGEVLAQKQLVQAMIADSWIDIEQFRLFVLRTAWKIDKLKNYKEVRADISAVKAQMPKVYHDVYARALQVHGSLGLSTEMPFAAGVLPRPGMVRMSPHSG